MRHFAAAAAATATARYIISVCTGNFTSICRQRPVPHWRRRPTDRSSVRQPVRSASIRPPPACPLIRWNDPTFSDSRNVGTPAVPRFRQIGPQTTRVQQHGCICQISSVVSAFLVLTIRTGTVPQLGTIAWWVVARSAGVCTREHLLEGRGLKATPWTCLWILVGGRTTWPIRRLIQPSKTGKMISDINISFLWLFKHKIRTATQEQRERDGDDQQGKIYTRIVVPSRAT